MVSNAIRSAQSQVESQNFEIRKDVLKYDEVLNRQRTVIYEERREVLEGADLQEQVRHMIDDTVHDYVSGATAEGFAEEWDLEQLWTALKTLYPVSVTVDEMVERSGGDIAGLTCGVPDRGDHALTRTRPTSGARRSSATRSMRELERRVVLSVLDRKWREHLYEMDYLQEGIGLRAIAQRDPLVEYQREGFDLFQAMMDSIKEESVGYLFNVDVSLEDVASEESDGGRPQRSLRCGSGTLRRAGSANGSAGQPAREIVARGLAAPSRPERLQFSAPSLDFGGQAETRGESADSEYSGISRNAPCPCGSGKKYKRCHGDPKNQGRNVV